MKVKTIALALAMVLPIGGGAIAGESLDIVGTGDGMGILRSLSAAFSEINPSVTVGIPDSIGSGGGIKAVGKGSHALGRVARPIKDKEKHYGLKYQPIAKIPVVFYVNKSVSVKDLSAEQIVGIYGGNIKNWKEVGGMDAPIRVVRREDGDSSLSVLQKTFPGFKDLVMAERAKTATSTPESLKVVETTNNTIGFGPYSGAVTADVNILSIGGLAPRNPAYMSVTTVALIYKPESRTGDVATFLNFTASMAGREAINSANALAY